jgi:hypothetical protein
MAEMSILILRIILDYLLLRQEGLIPGGRYIVEGRSSAERSIKRILVDYKLKRARVYNKKQ